MYAYITRYVRVYLTDTQYQFLDKFKNSESLLQSSLAPEELPTVKILADKCILVRKKLDNDIQYALNKSVRIIKQ